jgi:hypothetical protein
MATARLDDVVHPTDNDSTHSRSSYYNVGRIHQQNPLQTKENSSHEPENVTSSINMTETRASSYRETKDIRTRVTSSSVSSSSSSSSLSFSTEKYQASQMKYMTVDARNLNSHRSLQNLPNKPSEIEQDSKMISKTASLDFNQVPLASDWPGR